MTREGDHLGGDPRPILDDPREIKGSVCLVEEADGGKDGNDQVVMREIDIHGPVERKGLGGGKQGAVGLEAVVCGGIGEAGNEFVDVPDALNGSQGAAIPDE